MNQFSRKLGAIFYNCFAKRLPPSYSSLKVGQKALRAFCGKLMLRSCGKKVNIEQGAIFSSKTSLGDYSGIGINARINGTCTIGDYVMMGTDVVVITKNHAFNQTDIPMMQQGFEDERPVIIGNDVWIGSNATILAALPFPRGG